jgi:hypothetical protein
MRAKSKKAQAGQYPPLTFDVAVERMRAGAVLMYTPRMGWWHVTPGGWIEPATAAAIQALPGVTCLESAPRWPSVEQTWRMRVE